jgi:lysophospholipase
MKFVGSNFSGGILPQDQKCINGYDNAAFIMGTSSSLFNQFILNLNTTDGVPSGLKNILAQILTDIGVNNDDIASWSPNPFFGWNAGSNPTAQSKGLTLVDGGEDLQNIPLYPLLQPQREVDVIFAVDSSADTVEVAENWPNGTSLVATYERSLNTTMQNGTAFPSIPDQNTFVNLGLNAKPTFFGCDASNFTSQIPPLVVYIPNHPYIFNSNTSTFDLEYNNTERNVMIENGYLVATMGNATVDNQWPQCVGCAVMSRTWSKTNAQVPDVCKQCFQRYCWNGTRDSTTPPPFNPTSVFTEVSVRGAGNVLVPSLFSLIVALGSVIMLTL